MAIPLNERTTEADAHRVFVFLSQAIALAYFLDDDGARLVKKMIDDAGLTKAQVANARQLIDLASEED